MDNISEQKKNKMPEVIIGNTTFKYGEATSSKNRGIAMWREGVANDKHTYMFSPNPHDDKKYNKNQPQWYFTAASEIGERVERFGIWPVTGAVIIVFNIEYTLTLE